MIKTPSLVVAQTIDEIVKRFTQTTYGEISVESIRTIRIVGYISRKNGLPILYFVHEKKLPDMGSRSLRDQVNRRVDYTVNRKRIQRLMGLIEYQCHI